MPVDHCYSDILELPKSILRSRIEKELMENPVLECQLFDDPAPDTVGDPLAILQMPISVLRDRIEEELSDIMVTCSQAGEYHVRVAEDEHGPLIIGRRYTELQQDPAADPSTREYLGLKIKEAHRLLEALEWRRATLKQIGMAIFRQQRAFLEHGPGHIAPLSAEQVAREIGTPTPTIREAVKNKQVRSPHGIVSLDCFIVPPPEQSDQLAPCSGP
jgi:DNA-directed RNA polymerase specialized sigma54-like protein